MVIRFTAVSLGVIERMQSSIVAYPEDFLFQLIVYDTDRSEAVVPVLFLFFLWLCGLHYGALHV